MDKKNTTIKERILQIAVNKGFTYETFLNKVELKYANFKGKQKQTGINSKSIETIISVFPDINLHWLITGEKKHHSIEECEDVLKEHEDDYEILDIEITVKHQIKLIEAQKLTISELQKTKKFLMEQLDKCNK